GNLTRYRCHVGHTYSGDLMNIAMDENIRRALGSGQRALEERVALARRLHAQAETAGHPLTTASWASRIREYERELHVIAGAIRQMERIAADAERQEVD